MPQTTLTLPSPMRRTRKQGLNISPSVWGTDTEVTQYRLSEKHLVFFLPPPGINVAG